MFARWLIPAALALSGCVTGPPADETLVRIHNASARTLNSVRVDFGERSVSYGQLIPGQTSEYRPAGTAYRYAFMEAMVDGQRMTFQPIDYVGETPLGPGRHTYHVTIDAPTRSLRIVMQPGN